jgi:eukaryotic-like serine/threonine-protein kinase
MIMPVVTEAEISRKLGAFDAITPLGSPSGSGECWRLERGSDVSALKVIVKHPDPDRFDREVEALERVQSPRVMRLVSYGTDLEASDGTKYSYLLSEFIEGGDLREHLVAGSVPTDGELRSFLIGCLEGLIALHDQQIIHRDFKPENIVLRGGDWSDPVVIDLGLSRLLDLTTLTVYPWAGGTWPYMAPEQLQGERAIDRTDTWALGVVAGEVASGQHPFWRGEASPPTDWDQRLQAGVRVPGNRPAGLQALVDKAASYPAYRRASAAEALQLVNEVWTP